MKPDLNPLLFLSAHVLVQKSSTTDLLGLSDAAHPDNASLALAFFQRGFLDLRWFRVPSSVRKFFSLRHCTNFCLLLTLLIQDANQEVSRTLRSCPASLVPPRLHHSVPLSAKGGRSHGPHEHQRNRGLNVPLQEVEHWIPPHPRQEVTGSPPQRLQTKAALSK